jgi:hypothetical protein
MKLFAVFREGVYRHECGGIFTTMEAAKNCADVLAIRDLDSYHSYAVRKYESDALPILALTSSALRSPAIQESPEIYSVRRGKDGKAIIEAA